VIKVARPKAIPSVLRTRGNKLRKAHCRAYLRAPKVYRSGAKTFEFDRDVYGHAQVKEPLRTAQHDKCAFCESKLTHVAYGDVEHFRPKAGFRQRAKDALERPGYYWLAYAWENLLFACQICNQRHKQNAFPLQNPAKRARTHQDTLADEKPTFVDPAAEDPAAFLSFREEVPFGRNRRGAATIQALGLKRTPLTERRKDLLDALRANFVIAHALSPTESAVLIEEVRDARDVLRRAVADAGEFAAMVRAAIPVWEKEYGVRAP